MFLSLGGTCIDFGGTECLLKVNNSCIGSEVGNKKDEGPMMGVRILGKLRKEPRLSI